jgi:hypothetical protein
MPGHVTGRALRPLAAYLQRLGVIPRPVSAAAASPAEWLPARYREYLLVELHMGFVAADLGQQATP